ncbi:MAG: hypothetical protein EOM50_04110 [Erysipelotrichia bacterium]|nr:hypothetical protein [Erysipelotrichia bacterium]
MFYSIYTEQIVVSCFLLLLYLFGIILIRLFLKPTNKISYYLYSLFFGLYSLLTLLTQIELIHDPYNDFFVHNDSSWSFYKSYMDYVLPCSWAELPQKTLLSPAFYHYPLASLMMSAFGKIGIDLGVDNLRLFMRTQSVFLAAIIIPIISTLLESYGVKRDRIKKLLLLFGFFSYLYITSAIFNRDIHVCLVYTIGVYVCLKQDVKYKPIWFVALFFIALGLRPQNGFVFLAYPFFYYFKQIKKKLGPLGIILLTSVLLVGAVSMGDYFTKSVNSIALYDNLAMTNTGGLFIRLYTLPFPLNTIIMIIYMTLQPLPLFSYCMGEGMTWLNLPYCVSPYIIAVCILVCLHYIFKASNTNLFIRNIVLASLLVYAAIIFGSPDVRRAFAAIPGLYMCYGIIESKMPTKVLGNIQKSTWAIITFINIFFICYSYLE